MDLLAVCVCKLIVRGLAAEALFMAAVVAKAADITLRHVAPAAYPNLRHFGIYISGNF